MGNTASKRLRLHLAQAVALLAFTVQKGLQTRILLQLGIFVNPKVIHYLHFVCLVLSHGTTL
jgi:hypothetical protein